MMVSVCMITYNHEKYLPQAIEGVLSQETTFPVKLVIGDDASTDKTHEVAEDYAARYPDIVSYERNKDNLGMHDNFIKTLGRCDQKYIAFCEGDDYWVDDGKLEKQVEFLEENDSYVLCFHDSQRLFEKDTFGSVNKRVVDQQRPFDYSLNELLKKNIIPSQTILFRNHLVQKFPNWYYQCKGGDFPLYVLLSEHGKFKYLPFVGSRYRIHKGGISYGHKTDNAKAAIAFEKKLLSFDHINEHLKFQYDPVIKEEQQRISKQLLRLYFNLREFGKIALLVKDKRLDQKGLVFKDKVRVWLGILLNRLNSGVGMGDGIKQGSTGDS